MAQRCFLWAKGLLVHLDDNWVGAGRNYIHSHQTPRAARPLDQSGLWAQMASTSFLSPTYLGSFLQKSDNNRSVPAPHCPIQRAHSAVVDMLNHGPMIHQELDLGHMDQAVNTSAMAQYCSTEGSGCCLAFIQLLVCTGLGGHATSCHTYILGLQWCFEYCCPLDPRTFHQELSTCYSTPNHT